MFKEGLLKGKRLLVTGGGTGLGKSMARRFAELGAELFICGRRPEVLRETAEEMQRDFSCRAHDLPCDIRDPEAIEKILDKIWATGPLDGLVNNAAGNFLARSEELSPRAVDAVLNIVLHGTAYMTLACGRRWLQGHHSANVLSIVTTYAWSGSAYVVPSAMAKAGVLALTRSLAVEWGGRGIRLNAIAPGPFPTEGAWARLVPGKQVEVAWLKRIPLGRLGHHEELANLASYLMSGHSGYINGDVITIDGGEWLKGAGQFSFIGDLMSEDDWRNLKPKK